MGGGWRYFSQELMRKLTASQPLLAAVELTCSGWHPFTEEKHNIGSLSPKHTVIYTTHHILRRCQGRLERVRPRLLRS